MRNNLIKAIAQVADVSEDLVHLDIPEQESFGDYSTNIAMVNAKASKVSPQKLAEEYTQKLSQDSSLMSFVSTIKTAGPGFINFTLKNEHIIRELEEIKTKGNEYGKLRLEDKKIILEFGQPNTHKSPHIGHLYSYILGESLSRLLESVGNTVVRANYQGDVGLHVAKCLWAFQKNNPIIPDSLEEKVKVLQKMYQEGSRAYEEDERAKNEIIEINKQIYAHDPKIEKLWQETRDWNLEYYKNFEKRLGIGYDLYFFESEVYSKGVDIVRNSIGKVFKESEGATIFEGSKHGLHDRVFITKYGTPTYEAKDLALQEAKMENFNPDLIIITTANEQNAYFQVVFKALETLNKKFIGKLKHIGFGMVNLKTGKMSSRTGNIIGAVELVDMIVDEVAKINKDVAEEVGLGAVKYSFLKTNHLQNIQFDFEESISTDGNSGPYIQYAYARTQSVLQKAPKDRQLDNSCEGTIYPEERSVMRALSQYQEIIMLAAKNYSPNLLASFLFDLAQKYNAFYNKHKIIGSQKEEFRLLLTEATGIVLKNGLAILGIQAPEKM